MNAFWEKGRKKGYHKSLLFYRFGITELIIGLEPLKAGLFYGKHLYCSSGASGAFHVFGPVIFTTTVFKQTLRHHLEKQYSNHELARWFDPLRMVVDEESKVVRIFFPHAYFGLWFMNTMQKDFERQASSLAEGISIIYESKYGRADAFFPANKEQSLAEKALSSVPLAYTDSFSNYATPASRRELPGYADKPQTDTLCASARHPLLSQHTFGTFLANKKNDFPLAAAKDCASRVDNPPYTPFVIYGQSGTGKSHLLAAMANELLHHDVPFFYGEPSFLENVRTAPGRYNSVTEQAVFIDNAQRVADCPVMQDTLAALIDMFQATARLLVLCFSSHPSKCHGLVQNLCSRLTSGLVVELKRPDLDIRRQYAECKKNQYNLQLNQSDLLTIAQRYQDLRGIDGALTRLVAFRSLNQHAEISQADLASILNQGIDNTLLNPASIVFAVARHFSASPEDITGKTRDKAVTRARHISILLCRELLGLSLVQIGRFFGGRDHSSVLYSIKKIKQLQASDKDINNQVEELRKLCLNTR